MRSAHSPASRLAIAGTLSTVLLLLEQTAGAESASLRVVVMVLAALLLVGAIKMWFHNCFESRAMIVLGLSATAIGTLLSLTVGLPTSSPQSVGLGLLALIALPAAVVALLAFDARRRQRPSERSRSPYAL
ncbi:hypothetical protein ACLM5J_05475 [Nocardioides sp. Bht2]|uniref:hypothetical protein n=1 Tax=Nocardioides sp. Bht2 TaxID=3392297 RepID=UPI0039B56D8E